MSKTPTVATELSLRAAHVLCDVFHGWPLPPDDEPKRVEVFRLSKRSVKTRLQNEADSKGRTVLQVLMVARNCGAVTASEVLRWVGLPYDRGPHQCLCRFCGKRYGKRS